MYAQPTAPRTIGGVLDDSIQLYKASLPKIWPLALLSAILMAIPGLIVALSGLNSPSTDPRVAIKAMTSPVFGLSYIVVSLLYLMLYMAMISAINGTALGRQDTMAESLGVGARLIPRSFAAGFLFALMLLVAFLLLVIPGIYVWGIYQLAFVAIVVEDSRISDSFGISRRLIKGYWWRSATITSVAMVIALVLILLSGMISALLAGLFGLNTIAGVVSRTVVGGLLNSFGYALMPCVLVAMYYDLKLRHEGGDLAARVDALAAR